MVGFQASSVDASAIEVVIDGLCRAFVRHCVLLYNAMHTCVLYLLIYIALLGSVASQQCNNPESRKFVFIS